MRIYNCIKAWTQEIILCLSTCALKKSSIRIFIAFGRVHQFTQDFGYLIVDHLHTGLGSAFEFSQPVKVLNSTKPSGGRDPPNVSLASANKFRSRLF